MKKFFRPMLEYLERRLVPNASTWVGGTSTAWGDAMNWNNGVPGSSTDVTFTGTNNNPCDITGYSGLSAITIHSLTINNSYSKNITLSSSSVTISGTNSTLDGTSTNNVQVNSGSYLTFSGSTVDWEGGNLTTSAGSNTTLTINGGGNLDMVFPGTLSVGTTYVGDGTTSGTLTFDTNMTTNLTMANAASIRVQTNGTVNYSTTGAGTTCGGIKVTDSSNCTMYDYGAVNRSGSGLPLNNVAFTIPTSASSATLTIAAGDKIDFNTVTAANGYIYVGSGSHLQVDNGISIQNVADLMFMPSLSGNVTDYLDGSLTQSGSAILSGGYDTNMEHGTYWTTAAISGDWSSSGGSYDFGVSLALNGNGISDTVAVTGKFTGSTSLVLQFEEIGTQDNTKWNYKVVTYGTQAGGLPEVPAMGQIYSDSYQDDPPPATTGYLQLHAGA